MRFFHVMDGPHPVAPAFLRSRRVVAVGVDPDTTSAKEVMTPNPTSVSAESGAMDALGIMLERHFRHLPVRSLDGWR